MQYAQVQISKSHCHLWMPFFSPQPVFYPSLRCQDQREDKCWVRWWKISWKLLWDKKHLHKTNQDINKLDAYLFSHTPHTVKCAALLPESRTPPCGLWEPKIDWKGISQNWHLDQAVVPSHSHIYTLRSPHVKTLPSLCREWTWISS